MRCKFLAGPLWEPLRGRRMHRVEMIDLLLSNYDSAELTANRASIARKLLVTDDINQLAHVWPRSDRLGNARCSGYQCAELLKLLRETVALARNAQPLFVAITNEFDAPLVLMALTIESRFNVSVLKFLDGGLSEINTPVLFPLAKELPSATLPAILSVLAKTFRIDVAILEKMPLLVGDLRNPFFALNRSREYYSFHSMTLAKPSKIHKVYNRLKRKRRRLNERGKVTFRIAETAEEFDDLIEVLIAQKTQRYIETRGTDGLSRPGYKKFLRSAGRALYPAGPVCLFALKVDEVTVATTLGFVVGTKFYYSMPSFDSRNWSSYSPGHLLIVDIANWCLAKGLSSFEFGLGDESYKLDYCDLSTDLHRVECSYTIRGSIYLLLRRGRIMGSLLLQKLKRFPHRGA
jgi:CelD/BcsL family acetyltransferase involved in cellulose biosynthesis